MHILVLLSTCLFSENTSGQSVSLLAYIGRDAHLGSSFKVLFHLIGTRNVSWLSHTVLGIARTALVDEANYAGSVQQN